LRKPNNKKYHRTPKNYKHRLS